jgi:hypothetical protein
MLLILPPHITSAQKFPKSFSARHERQFDSDHLTQLRPSAEALEVTHPVAVAARVPNRLSEGLPDSRWGARVPQQCAVLGHDGQGWVRRQVTVIVAVGNRPVTNFLAFTKATLGEAVAEVRVSDRLTDSAVCLVAAEHGPDRQLESCWPARGGSHPRQSRSRK